MYMYIDVIFRVRDRTWICTHDFFSPQSCLAADPESSGCGAQFH